MTFYQAGSMDIDILPRSFRSTISLIDMPENIWLDIFSYLSLEEKFKAAGALPRFLFGSGSFSSIVPAAHGTASSLTLPSTHISLSTTWSSTPRIRSLRIANCHSSFISKTTVPVQNTSIMHHFPQHQGMHSLHTHITSFTLPRRREEYRKLGFTLHQDFSRALATLMEQSQVSL
ncbi:hypothetical protein BGX24_009851, partial [Mortierella sp. AD032]